MDTLFLVHTAEEKVFEAYPSIHISILPLDQRSSLKARPLSAVWAAFLEGFFSLTKKLGKQLNLTFDVILVITHKQTVLVKIFSRL